MSHLILNTSGSTDDPKRVKHSWTYIKECAFRSIQEINLNETDRVLDVFPANVIAHYTVTAYPAILSGANLCSIVFDPYRYIAMFKELKPTYISLLPRHLEILKNTKGFSSLDMSCVKYMVTGSSKIENEFINVFRNHGVKIVANWYGMTEFPPPILIGYNSTSFSFRPTNDKIVFEPLADDTNLAEVIINDQPTGDIFNTIDMTFHSRTKKLNGKTWKTNF